MGDPLRQHGACDAADRLRGSGVGDQLRRHLGPEQQQWPQLRRYAGEQHPPESCKAMCSNTMQQPLCLGWTVLNNDDCYLKRDVDDMQYDPGVKGSGYCHPNCGDEQIHQNNDGHNIDSFNVVHKEFCMMKCQADSRCEGWTVDNDGTCYLKDRVQPMRADDGVQASGFCAHR